MFYSGIIKSHNSKRAFSTCNHTIIIIRYRHNNNIYFFKPYKFISCLKYLVHAKKLKFKIRWNSISFFSISGETHIILFRSNYLIVLCCAVKWTRINKFSKQNLENHGLHISMCEIYTIFKNIIDYFYKSDYNLISSHNIYYD